MSQTNTGASHIGGRLFRSVATTALAVTALAGSVTLSNSEARAAGCMSPQGPIGGFFMSFAAPPDLIGVSGQCILSSPFAMQANVDVDFNPNMADSSGMFQYALTSSVGNFMMARIDSDTDGIGGTTSVLKQIFKNPDFTGLIGSGTSINGAPVDISLSEYLSTIYVKDTYSSSGTTKLDNLTNTFQTPGPLPVLAAGTAFGFSRKLRSRIKASRTA